LSHLVYGNNIAHANHHLLMQWSVGVGGGGGGGGGGWGWGWGGMIKHCKEHICCGFSLNFMLCDILSRNRRSTH
jgi:hypothetical protein